MNEASDRVSDAEAARPVLEVYRGERLKKSMPTVLQVCPQVRQGCPQAQLGSTVEERAQICNARSENGLNACEDLHEVSNFWGEYRTYPGFWGTRVEWRRIRARARVPMGAEDENTGADESCCVGGRHCRVVPPLGMDTVTIMAEEAAADEPRLGKFPYVDS
ncbi:hypothetical protein FB451DRAFT_1179868 [Mycena latifolia]|nr:hypothetical protein FB451DRAFT_1179868 [Mycena latifolia]